MTDLLHRPWTTGSSIRGSLFALEARFAEQDDRRAIFATAYAWMTSSIDAQIDAEVFDDPGWVVELTAVFAEYYRQALSEQARGGTSPRCWEIALEATDTVVLQDLLLGMNAHITYDLPLALAELVGPLCRAQCLRDYRRILTAIRGAIEIIQVQIVSRYAPGLRLLEHAFAGVDDWLTYHVIRLYREDAWRQGMLMIDHPQDRPELVAKIDAEAARRARWILDLSRRPAFTWALHRVESFDLREHYARLSRGLSTTLTLPTWPFRLTPGEGASSKRRRGGRSDTAWAAKTLE